MGETSQKWHRDIFVNEGSTSVKKGASFLWALKGSRRLGVVHSDETECEVLLQEGQVYFGNFYVKHHGISDPKTQNSIALHAYIVLGGAHHYPANQYSDRHAALIFVCTLAASINEDDLDRPQVFQQPFACTVCMKSLFDSNVLTLIHGCGHMKHIPCAMRAVFLGRFFCDECKKLHDIPEFSLQPFMQANQKILLPLMNERDGEVWHTPEDGKRELLNRLIELPLCESSVGYPQHSSEQLLHNMRLRLNELLDGDFSAVSPNNPS